MERKIICPRCGKETFYVYRFTDSADFAGCENCASQLDKAVGYYDMRDYPEDYKPTKIRCPVCGELCRKTYRKARYFEIIGCEHCLIELDADEDASVHPGDYGLPDDEEEINNGYRKA